MRRTASLEPNQLQDTIRLLMLTVPRFIDHQSRQAVLDVLESLLSRPSVEGSTTSGKIVANSMIRWLEAESLKPTPSSTRFVVLTWACTVFAKSEELADPQWNSLVNSFAILLDGLLDPQRAAKPSLRQAALTVSRRAVRSVSLARVHQNP